MQQWQMHYFTIQKKIYKTSQRMSGSNFKTLHVSLKGWESTLFLRKQSFSFPKEKTTQLKQSYNWLTCCTSQKTIQKDNEFYIFTLYCNRFWQEKGNKAACNCSFPKSIIIGSHCSVCAFLNHHATDTDHVSCKNQ